ncbi:MAG: rRNA pseudouridine synthase [Bacilli bacterium]|nr:rRNA pseudouridine synthase [Bacilli bacterium]
MERLQKRIAESGVCSRRKAEELITAGKVKVNGVVITLLGTKVSYNDVIEVDGKIIEKEEKKYYVINKPRGVVCTASDDRGRKTILDILPERIKQERIYPVGRLDYDTKGVLLLTNDGEFMNAMVGPKSGIEKEYLARVKGIMTMTDVKKLTEGVVLNGKKTLPAVVEIVSFDREHGSSLVKIIITEGNYHQVKEMFKSIDHEVKKLTRVRFGNINVNNLKEGEIKVLSIHEVKTLYGLAKQSRNINKHKE